MGHFGNSTGIVGNGTVGINRNHHTSGGQHANRGYGDAVDTARDAACGSVTESLLPTPLGNSYANENENHGSGNRNHSGGDATEHGCSGTSF